MVYSELYTDKFLYCMFTGIMESEKYYYTEAIHECSETDTHIYWVLWYICINNVHYILLDLLLEQYNKLINSIIN